MSETHDNDVDLPIGLLESDDPEHGGSPPDDGRPGQRTVVLIIYAPRATEPREFRFKLDTTVGDAAATAAAAFQYEPGTPSLQRKDGTVLDRSLTLAAAEVQHREEFDLVDVGGGV